MSNVDNEYDLRQYRRMLDLIASYKDDKLTLQILVDNLEALRRALTKPSRSWLDQFEHLRGVLEDVNAIMLDNKDTVLSNNNRKLVAQSIEELIPLIQREMNMRASQV